MVEDIKAIKILLETISIVFIPTLIMVESRIIIINNTWHLNDFYYYYSINTKTATAYNCYTISVISHTPPSYVWY